MNLQTPGANDAIQTRSRSRNVAPSSGICTRCMDNCPGECDIFRASMRGREVIYPGPFGNITAGSDKDYGVDYSHLNVMGYALGAKAIDEANPDKAIFPDVDTATVYGHTHPVRMTMPIFTGALGSTDIARTHWNSFAVGAAISGISLVVGENVCGIDPELELNADGKVVRSPEMERRLKLYKSWQAEFGDIIVQLNVEDTRLGVAEYVVDQLGVETIELKWGQGAKCIGGEIKIRDLDRALELQRRGYIITPNPANKVLAMGAPYFKAVCMGRALMVPGFVCDNVEAVLKNGSDRNWEKLPNTVSKYGQTPEQIFTTYATLKDEYGSKAEDIPFGAVALYTFIDKLKTGLTQFMAGARSFRLDTLSRSDVIALTEEAAKVAGLTYVMDAQREEAMRILES